MSHKQMEQYHSRWSRCTIDQQYSFKNCLQRRYHM